MKKAPYLASFSSTAAVIRRVWWHERDRLTEHLLRLPSEDRYQRFGGYLSDGEIRAYTERKQWFSGYVVGAYMRGQLRGVAEFELRNRDWPREAEVALSVEPAFRWQGIGRRLFKSLLLLARNRFVHRIYLTTQADNVAVRRLARNSGMQLHPENGHLIGARALQWPDGLSMLDEMIFEGWSLALDAPLNPSVMSPCFGVCRQIERHANHRP